MKKWDLNEVKNQNLSKEQQCFFYHIAQTFSEHKTV